VSVVRSLRIRLGTTHVGSLFGLDDGRVYFRFDDAYAKDPARPVLSQLYVVAPVPGRDAQSAAQAVASAEAATVAQLLDPGLDVNRGDGKFGLPPFFQNLLPEGPLRKQLIGDLGLAVDDELGLLAACGGDLPGDVWADAETLDDAALGRLIGQSRDSYEMSSGQVPTPQQTSISGMQPKVALVLDGPGRYVMRSRQLAGRHFIGKLPTSEFERLPEVEYGALKLAAAAGVEVCDFSLAPLSVIADRLPYAMQQDGRNFLLVSRFDRDVDTATHRLHIEDFAQVTGTPAAGKYAGTYAAIGLLLKRRSTRGEADVDELLRRIKVSELLGNYDAHLKNFSLIYPPGEVGPRLSPAYDIVAYGIYITGSGHGLPFLPDQQKRTLLTPRTLRDLANAWDIPEKRLRDSVTRCVDQAMKSWPALLKELPLSAPHRARLGQYIQRNADVLSWRKRHPDAAWFD
jgi:serine/threonine-protein kinase HipA